MRERRKNAEQRRKNLFMTKRLHGIDSRCAACGEITRKSSGHEQHGDHDDERERIERGDAEQQVSQDERNGNGSDRAENEAEKYRSEALPHGERENLARERSEDDSSPISRTRRVTE